MAFTAILLGAFLAQAFAAYGLRATLVSSIPVRAAIAHGQFNVTIKFVYLALGAIALSAVVSALAPTGRQRWTWIAITLLCLASLYFATGRGTIVDGAVVAVTAYAVALPRLPRKRTLVVGGVVAVMFTLVVFLAGGAVIGKTLSNDADLQAVPSVFIRHRLFSNLALPYEYASSPIAALDVQVGAATTWGDAHGCAAFPELCSAADKLGLGLPTVPRLRAFTAPPLSWNTYTALDAPLIDGGTALTIPILAAIGLLIGLLWTAALRRQLVGLLGYPLAAVALVTANSGFNFTAPHLLGGFLVSIGAVWVSQFSTQRRTKLHSTNSPPRSVSALD